MKSSTLDDYEARICKVMSYIQKNLDGDLSLENLAHISCFSPYHFHRIFRDHIGESTHKHIMRLRMEKAAFKLRHSNDSVISILRSCGYHSQSVFNKAFRHYFGISPAAFRNWGTGRTYIGQCARLQA